MKTLTLGILVILGIVGVVSAISIQPTYVYNSISNTLTLSISSGQLSSQQLAYGQNLTIQISNITITGVTLNRNSSSTQTSSTSYSVILTAPPNNFKPIGKTYNCTYGEAPIENVTYALIINCPPAINRNITLGYNSIYSNNALNLTIISPKKTQWNIDESITPLWNSNTVIVNNEVNATIIVNKIPPLNITKHLPIGGNYKNSTYGLNITAAPFTSNSINYTDLQGWYNTNVQNDCAQTINVTTGNVTQSYCAKTKGQENASIYNICTGYDLSTNNLSQGLGQCVIDFHTADVENATEWHNQYVYTTNALASGSLAYDNAQLETELQAEKTTASNLQLDITYGTEQSLGIYAVVALGLISMGYLKKKRRDTSLNS
jgi:hypothetical protein